MRVGLLVPGEMGAAVGAAARAEVVWASEGRSEATARRAADAGLVDVGSVADLVRSSEIVLSICPPAIAEEVAAQVAGLGFEGLRGGERRLADANGAHRRAAAVHRRRLDHRTTGHPPLSRRRRGGRRARRRALRRIRRSGLFPGPEDRRRLGAEDGLRRLEQDRHRPDRAGARDRAGLRADALEAEGVEAGRVERFAPRAWRWAPEMEEVADTCAELGLNDAMARGAAASYARLAEGLRVESG